MKIKKWNEQWYFWKMDNSFAIGNGIAKDAVLLNLPHDAMNTEIPRADSPNGNNTGFRNSAVYKYAKILFVNEEDRGKTVVLNFEGIYMNAMVYVNGQLAGKNMWGYSSFYVNLTPFLKYGMENLITVEVRGAMKNSRWYSGAGIYRDVYLLTAENCYIKPQGIQLKTLEADADIAVIRMSLDVENRSGDTQQVLYTYRICDSDGKEVTQGFCSAVLYEKDTRKLIQKIAVSDPKCWSAETPELYQCQVSLFRVDSISGEKILLDEAVTEFGIRTISADGKRGLRVNGKMINLRGASIHHDSGLIGTATYESVQYRQIYKLKKAGFNAIRMSHHPSAPALLRACDHIGMYVLDEGFDMWNQCKSDFDYGLNFQEHWKEDINLMIKKDYNHPSVILYSVGNEIPEFGTDQGTKICADICSYIRSLDDSRLLTSGINGIHMTGEHLDEIVKEVLDGTGIVPTGTVNDYLTVMDQYMDKLVVHDVITDSLDKLCAPLDVAGYNYMASRYELDTACRPDRVIVGSETYPPEIAHNWSLVKKHNAVVGDFTWTGWDYIGESGVGVPGYKPGEAGFGAPFPIILAYCGDIDITGFRRPMSYYRELVFGKSKTPYIAIQNPAHYGEKPLFTPWILGDLSASWTWPGYEKKPVIVEVYSAGDKVELIKNGKVIDVQPSGESVDYRAYFHTTYEPGILEAVSYANGVEIGRCALQTVKETTYLQAKVEKMSDYMDQEIADQDRIAFVDLTMRDEYGISDYNSTELVSVDVQGDVEWIVSGSADPRYTYSPYENKMQLFEGRGQVILKKKNVDDRVKITLQYGNQNQTEVMI